MSTRPSWRPVRADLSRPSAARIYDYLLGGSSNFAVDRKFAHAALEIFPAAREYARLNRLFLQRVVRFFVEQGVRQFLDIGCGIPNVGSVHQIAQDLAPGSRVVYVDNEAIAIAHSQLVLRDNPHATIIQGDLTAPEELMATPELNATLGVEKPIGVLMLAALHFVPDTHDLPELISRYQRLLAPHSYLALSHGTDEHLPEISALGALYRKTTNTLVWRTREQVTALFKDFELLEPGVVLTPEWRPTAPEDVGDTPERSACYAAVGRKPSS